MASILQLAGMLPRDPQFREFVSQYMVPVREPTVDEAAAFIRVACQVESRRELATSTIAQTRFHKLIRLPFLAWRARQHPKTHIRALERNQPLRRAA